jgi:hypothetical protein
MKLVFEVFTITEIDFDEIGSVWHVYLFIFPYYPFMLEDLHVAGFVLH